MPELLIADELTKDFLIMLGPEPRVGRTQRHYQYKQQTLLHVSYKAVSTFFIVTKLTFPHFQPHIAQWLLYRVSQEEFEIIRESVPYVKLY